MAGKIRLCCTHPSWSARCHQRCLVSGCSTRASRRRHSDIAAHSDAAKETQMALMSGIYVVQCVWTTKYNVLHRLYNTQCRKQGSAHRLEAAQAREIPCYLERESPQDGGTSYCGKLSILRESRGSPSRSIPVCAHGTVCCFGLIRVLRVKNTETLPAEVHSGVLLGD